MPLPLELRKSFQIAIAILSILFTLISWYTIHSALPISASTANVVLSLLLGIFFLGFYNMLRLLLPILVVYIWPKLESE